MKHHIEILLDPYLEDAIDSALSEVEEAIDNLRKYHPAGVSTIVEVDLDELLAEHRAIAHIWSAGDVKDAYPHLTDEQAWDVLQTCAAELDPLHGLCLDDIKRVASEKFDITGERLSKCSRTITEYGDDLPESNLIDLLTDVMHWCDTNGHTFQRLVEQASQHFTEETTSE